MISPDFGGYSHFIQSRTNERRIIDFVELGIADIQSLGRYEYHVVRPGLSNHSHLGAVEISYLVRGCQTYRAGGREYRLVGGDVFVTAQGEPHDTAGQPEDCGALYWLIIRLSQKGGSQLMLPPADSAVIASSLLVEARSTGESVAVLHS